MAIQYEHPDHPEAYARIARIEIHRYVDEPVRFEAVWQAWHSKARRDENAPTIDNGRSEVSSPEITQAYQDLKLTFEGAIDV